MPRKYVKSGKYGGKIGLANIFKRKYVRSGKYANLRARRDASRAARNAKRLFRNLPGM